MKRHLKYLVKQIPGISYIWNVMAESRLKRLDVESRFTNIFLNNGWGDKSSLSGTGSNADATREVLKVLSKTIEELNVRTLLDIPCGDHYWIKSLDLNGVAYIGADIVKPLIEKNIKNFSGKNKSFCQLDIITGDLPKVDMIFCRDCLVHLSESDIKAAIQNMCRSGSRYLLTTTFPRHKFNEDIITGRWRPINLEIPPFNFPKPLNIYSEGYRDDNDYDDKSLALWEIKFL